MNFRVRPFLALWAIMMGVSLGFQCTHPLWAAPGGKPKAPTTKSATAPGTKIALPAPSKDVPNGYKATLNWGAVTNSTTGTALTPPVTYSVYNVNATAASIAQSGITGLTWTSPSLTTVGSACWSITATAQSSEGAQSNIVCVNVLPVAPPPVLIPAAPTGLTVTSVGP